MGLLRHTPPPLRAVSMGAAMAGLLCGACPDETPPLPTEEVTASALPSIEVRAGRELLLTYADADGSFHSVDSIDEVPDARRGWVRVVDLGVKPERRRDHELVYVADLRQADDDGAYPYVVLSRRAFETAATSRQGGALPRRPSHGPGGPAGAASQPAGGHRERPRVVLYSTSWCPACRAARRYLERNKIPFVERDIESDPKASAELLSKARRAGISASGVPVLDVDGTLVQGFDPDRITKLLGED